MLSKHKNAEAKKSYSKKELNILVSQQLAKVLKKDKGKLTKKSKKKANEMDAFNYDIEESSNDKASVKSEESDDDLDMETFEAWMAVAIANQNRLEKRRYEQYNLHIRDHLHN